MGPKPYKTEFQTSVEVFSLCSLFHVYQMEAKFIFWHPCFESKYEDGLLIRC